MIAAPPLRRGIALAGLMAALLTTAYTFRADPPSAAQAVTTAPCTSCDARHARPQDLRTALEKKK